MPQTGAIRVYILYKIRSRSLFIIIFPSECVCVCARTRTRIFCVYGCKTRPTDRLSGRPTRRGRTIVSVQCVCGPGRRDAHARSSLSPCDRKYFVDTGERGGGGGGGGIGRRPRWEGMRGALRPSLRRRTRGEGCEPDSRRRRSRLSRRTPHAADHPSSPKHHSTHHPAPVSRLPPPTPGGSKNRVRHRTALRTVVQDPLTYPFAAVMYTRRRDTNFTPSFIRTSAVALANLRRPGRTTPTDRTSVWGAYAFK